MDGLNDPPVTKVVASPIYIGPGPLPKILSGKGSNNGGLIRRGAASTSYPDKSGLRLRKALW